jgi:hypothetical protein
MPRHAVSAVLALIVLSGCASRAPVSPDQVSIHQSVTSAPVRYEVIKRLWIESWSSAFGTPSYSSQNEAEEAFRQKAASLGGNGVINFGCYSKPGIFGSTYLGCNGTVVKFL